MNTSWSCGRPFHDRDAVVSLSGGQDSTTCLAWARRNFRRVHAVTFDYGQRHALEIEAARKVADYFRVDSHEIVVLGDSILKSTSPLVDKTQQLGLYKNVESLPGGVEATFIPARNILFLTLLANRAVALGAADLVIGVCEADYGGYPDCHGEFLSSMEESLSRGVFDPDTYSKFTIHAPLMYLLKSQTVGVLASYGSFAYESLKHTHTCYDGTYPPNPKDHACLLRARGFKEAGLPDPLIQRAKKEGLLPATYPDHGLVEE